MDYAIKLSRAHRTGDRWRFANRYTQRVSTSVATPTGRASPRRNDIWMKAHGVVEDLVVNDNSMPTKIAVRIERWDQGSDAEMPGYFSPGQTLLVEFQGGEPICTVDGELITDGEKYTCTLLGLMGWESPYEDLFAATTVRRRIGESWPVDVRVASTGLGAVMEGYSIPPLVGDFKLVGVTLDHAEECLEVAGSLRLPGQPADLLPDQCNRMTDTTSLDVSVSGLWPLDHRLPVRRLTETVKSEHLSQITLPNGTTLLIETSLEMVRSVAFAGGA